MDSIDTDINSYSLIDGSIAPGASATISLEVQNNGDVTIEGLIAEMISPSNLITVTDSSIDYGDIAIGETVFSEESFSLSFSILIESFKRSFLWSISSF